MKKRLPSLFLYLVISIFIIGWWTYVFKEENIPSIYSSISADTPSLALQTSALFPFLSPLKREDIRQALNGDVNLILQLIIDWDVDAQFLISQGKRAQRIDSDHYVQAHLIHRSLKSSSNTETPRSRFFPQTHVAASFLLAIAKPQEIIAIPGSMRDLPKLYPSSLLNQIAYNTEELRDEKLFLARPQIAFISSYSHPATVQALTKQGIQLFSLKSCEKLSDITDALVQIGHATNHLLEASLLNIFIEACLLHLDNRMALLKDFASNSDKKVLYVYYNQGYMLPTNKGLTGQLLQRASCYKPELSSSIVPSQHEWRVPLTNEQLLQINPHYLIISSYQAEKMENTLASQSVLKNLQLEKIFYVDEYIQESPTQYIVLAYFDLFQALAAAYLI